MCAGLEPGAGRYVDDDANQANRTDRSGNPYTSSNYKYNWDEGTGTVGSGITFVDAPGITPHCMKLGSCDTSPGGEASNIFQTLGVYDDFNSDTRLLGNWQWPIPKNYLNGTDRYPVGLPLEYTDANGNLKQLVFDAQDAGRSQVTLILSLGIDALSEAAGGKFSGSDFLNFNYLFIPKDMTALNDDNSWDPDGSGPGLPTGSPWSCNGAGGAGLTNCPGHVIGNNSGGAFSPQLIVRVPEPASMLLLTLGLLATAGIRRRK